MSSSYLYIKIHIFIKLKEFTVSSLTDPAPQGSFYPSTLAFGTSFPDSQKPGCLLICSTLFTYLLICSTVVCLQFLESLTHAPVRNKLSSQSTVIIYSSFCLQSQFPIKTMFSKVTQVSSFFPHLESHEVILCPICLILRYICQSLLPLWNSPQRPGLDILKFTYIKVLCDVQFYGLQQIHDFIFKQIIGKLHSWQHTWNTPDN